MKISACTLLQRVTHYFGAHRAEFRVLHELDRATYRIRIAFSFAALALWAQLVDGRDELMLTTLPAIAVAYGLWAWVYRRWIQAQPESLVLTQHVQIVVDQALTVWALTVMPQLIAPLMPLMTVQIVRPGFRFGNRCMWLAWGASVLASLLLMPLNGHWALGEQLTQTYIVMLAVIPHLFGPLNRHLDRLTADLRASATSDPLTGLGNRRMLSEHLRQAQARSRRDGSSLALILFDLDRFKAVNDTLGHAAGDRLLVRIAQTVQALAREGDFLARIGGDEFVLLVEGLPAQAAQRHAEGLRERIVAAVQQAAEALSPGLGVSASVGIQCQAGADAARSDDMDLMDATDRAMYVAKRAKQAGRSGSALAS
ncbi:MAG: hypothetical protein RJA98_2353 [Pseudomonadota bacterium]|jgi:diguanylate cyclase (GGDEF)-like protein